jgi:hypothetical protein
MLEPDNSGARGMDGRRRILSSELDDEVPRMLGRGGAELDNLDECKVRPLCVSSSVATDCSTAAASLGEGSRGGVGGCFLDKEGRRGGVDGCFLTTDEGSREGGGSAGATYSGDFKRADLGERREFKSSLGESG